MTVSELITELQLLEDQGLGDEEVTLAADEEGNDFRPIDEVTADDDIIIWPC